MSLRYEAGDKRRPYIACDASGCANRLRINARNFALGASLTPLASTGWATVDPEAERRDFCADHADQATAETAG
jgi:hypothetical protein